MLTCMRAKILRNQAELADAMSDITEQCIKTEAQAKALIEKYW